MKGFIISQRRTDGSFPGWHKVACPGLLDAAPFAAKRISGYLLEIWEDEEEAKAALDEIVRVIGPYYFLFPVTIELQNT
jgi:hypothetical protein